MYPPSVMTCHIRHESTVKSTINTPRELLGRLSGEEARGCCTKVGGTGINFPGKGVENSLVVVFVIAA